MVQRVLDAKLHDVWSRWTQADRVMQWWGPHGYSAPSAHMDVRPGRRSLLCMRSPDGEETYTTWEYVRVVPMRYLEFVQQRSDERGVVKYDPGGPSSIRTRVMLVTDGHRTQMTLLLDVPARHAARIKHGLEQSVEKFVLAA